MVFLADFLLMNLIYFQIKKNHLAGLRGGRRKTAKWFSNKPQSSLKTKWQGA